MSRAFCLHVQNDFLQRFNTKLRLKDLKMGERFFVVARREATGVPIGTSRPSNTATADKICSDESFKPVFSISSQTQVDIIYIQ